MRKSLKNKFKSIEIDIKSLKSQLKHGHYTKIALKLKKTPQWISIQFNKENVTLSLATVKAALQVLQEEQDEINELNKLINKK